MLVKPSDADETTPPRLTVCFPEASYPDDELWKTNPRVTLYYVTLTSKRLHYSKLLRLYIFTYIFLAFAFRLCVGCGYILLSQALAEMALFKTGFILDVPQTALHQLNCWSNKCFKIPECL